LTFFYVLFEGSQLSVMRKQLTADQRAWLVPSLVGDVKATLQGLTPLIQPKSNRAFLTEAQSRMRDWNGLLDRIEQTNRSPLRPQMVVRAVSDLIAPDSVISLDCGANTYFAARHLRIKAGQRLTSPGMLATMAPDRIRQRYGPRPNRFIRPGASSP
jgi:thiamine pyrophosphate-dependent acetolactate synthase large subunit-like protein